MNVSDTTMIATISIVMVFFISRIVDRQIPIPKFKCGSVQKDEFVQCLQRQSVFIKRAQSQKFNYMIAIGAILMMVGTQLFRNQDKSRHLGLSCSMAGMMIISYQTVSNWFNFSDDTKLLIQGGLLMFLGTLSYQNTPSMYY